MLIDELPGVYFKERVSYELSGEGSKIPIFIGKSGNSFETTTTSNSQSTTEGEGEDTPQTTNTQTQTAEIKYKVDGTSYLKFERFSDALRPVVTTDVSKTEGGVTTITKWDEATGVGEYVTYDANGLPVYHDENPLAKRIYEFHQESKLLQSTDIGVPYFYVIDVGTGTSLRAWENALETAKTLTDAEVEIYIGAENITGCTLEEFYIKAVDSIFEDSEELDLRYGFGTLERTAQETLKEYDARLKKLSNDLRSNYGGAFLYKLSRFGLCEELLFGKTMARICCTPYNTEPGYYKYRSVVPDTFNKRLKEDMKSLQDNGIIFNRDEQVNGTKYPRINLCVSCAFGSTTDRPADALFHARFNSDDLLREVFEVCFKQIKRNESETNIAYLQSDINRIVNTRVMNEEMIGYDDRTEIGTRLIVTESNDEPYNLIVTGQIQPVKCTIAIRVEATIKV